MGKFRSCCIHFFLVPQAKWIESQTNMNKEAQLVSRLYFRLWALGHATVFVTPLVIIAIMQANQFIPTWPVDVLVVVFVGHIAYLVVGVVLLRGRRIQAATVGITGWLICLPIWVWAFSVLLQND